MRSPKASDQDCSCDEVETLHELDRLDVECFLENGGSVDCHDGEDRERAEEDLKPAGFLRLRPGESRSECSESEWFRMVSVGSESRPCQRPSWVAGARAGVSPACLSRRKGESANFTVILARFSRVSRMPDEGPFVPTMSQIGGKSCRRVLYFQPAQRMLGHYSARARTGGEVPAAGNPTDGPHPG